MRLRGESDKNSNGIAMRAEVCGRQFGLCGYFVALLRFKKLWLVDMFVVLKDHVTCFTSVSQ